MKNKDTDIKNGKANGRMISVPAIAIILIFITLLGSLTGVVLAQDKNQDEKIQENTIKNAVLESTLATQTKTLQRVEDKMDRLLSAVIDCKTETKDD